VEVRVLGAPAVTAPGPVDPDRLGWLTEVVAYLSLRDVPTEPAALAAALGPAAATAGTLSDLRSWLGEDARGRPRVEVLDDGRWRLADDVRRDWDLFVAYADRAGAPGADSEGDLVTALRLVGGSPLAGTGDGGYGEGGYGWVAGELADGINAAIVDVTHRLVELTLGYGETNVALAACRTGLRAVPGSEELWRDLLRTAATRGDRDALDGLVHAMYEAVVPAGAPGRLGTRTEELVAELLPDRSGRSHLYHHSGHSGYSGRAEDAKNAGNAGFAEDQLR
jgi:hypothetical protein